MIPLVVKPKFIEFRRRYLPNIFTSQGRKNIFALLFIFFLISVFTEIGFQSIDILKDDPYNYARRSATLIRVIVHLLFLMLFCTNLISAVHTLFYSRDLDLILTAPVTNWQLFTGKFLESLFLNCWIILVLGLPALIGVGLSSLADPLFFIAAPLLTLVLFSVPTSLAIFGLILLGRFFSLNKLKEIFLVVVLISMSILIITFQRREISFDLLTSERQLYIELDRRLPNWWFLPSSWLSQILIDLIQQGRLNWSYTVIMISFAGLLMFLAYLCMKKFYFEALNRSRTATSIAVSKMYDLPKWLKPSAGTAFLGKDYRCFVRDLTQALQMLLLLTLAVFYFYNFNFLQLPNTISYEALQLWNSGIILLNILLGGLVLLAICNHFVFSSISLEGRSFWIVQSAPITPEQLLLAKTRLWWLIVTTLAILLFVAGSISVEAKFTMVAFQILTAFTLSYGLVGLVTGVGAYFAKFDWQHTYQITTSLGSLFFMVIGILVLMLNLIPSALVFGSQIADSKYQESILALAVMLSLGIDLSVSYLAMRIGAKALSKHYNQ